MKDRKSADDEEKGGEDESIEPAPIGPSQQAKKAALDRAYAPGDNIHTCLETREKFDGLVDRVLNDEQFLAMFDNIEIREKSKHSEQNQQLRPNITPEKNSQTPDMREAFGLNKCLF